jgi:peptidyl-prolyl cis-trans isomerase A (cyclophilin A)
VKTPSRRALIVGAGALAAAGTASAQDQSQGQTPPAAPPPPPARPRVVVTTALGAITMELASDKAPITCANFLRYVDAKKFDNQSFYRALKVMSSPPIGLIQGGADRVGRFKGIDHESTLQTGLSHRNGAVSMARAGLGTATADFFICVDDLSSSLDGKPSPPGVDNQGFAVFGQVADGMDVVKAILAAHTSPTAGIGPMKGEILSPPIPIVSVRRAKADAAA